MARKRYLLSTAALVFIVCGLVATPSQAQWVTDCDDSFCDGAVRFGWWGSHVTGSTVKTGEYQDLSPSPFWDIDGLSSNGRRTLDYHATGTDRESGSAGLHYFGPRLTVDADYLRFPHQLGRDDLTNFEPAKQLEQQGAPFSSSKPLVLSRDRQDVGEEYAIRVQELKTTLKGEIAENLRWKLNVWGQRKEGERQTAALGHCYRYKYNTGNPNAQPASPDPAIPPDTIRSDTTCHMVSQRQSIDWVTMEIEPVLETKLGDLTIEYSHPIRGFSQDDGLVSRDYTQSGHEGWIYPPAGAVPYAMTADTLTQMDKLKIGYDVTETDHIYAFGLYGNTENQVRETNRKFNNIDVRWTNDAIAGVNVTTYGKRYEQTGQLPPDVPYEEHYLQGATSGSTGGDPGYQHPINYEKTAAGVKGRWRPSESGWNVNKGISFVSGYEYSTIKREYAVTEFESPGLGEFDQPTTVGHMFQFAALRRWSPSLDTFLRYKMQLNEDPLYGLRLTTTDVNSALPTSVDTVEVGGTWFPSESFMLTTTVGFEQRHHDTWHDNTDQYYGLLVDEGGNALLGRPLPNPRETYFNEDSYPVTVTAWWAPTCKWSLSAGYATYQSTLGQLITIGDQYNDGVYKTSARNYVEADAFQSLWRHETRAHVANVGATYKWNECWKFTGGTEYVRGEDVTTPVAPDIAYAPTKSSSGAYQYVTPNWSYITPGSDVIVETWRITGGFDYVFSRRASTYFRYNFYQFTDLAGNEGNGNGGSGIAHLFLGGVTATF